MFAHPAGRICPTRIPLPFRPTFPCERGAASRDGVLFANDAVTTWSFGRWAGWRLRKQHHSCDQY